MNEVRLGGWFATEIALGDGTDQAPSFIIRVSTEPDRENFFRVVCMEDAARVVAEAAKERLLFGVPVEVFGSLRQEIVDDSSGTACKIVRVWATKAKIA